MTPEVYLTVSKNSLLRDKLKCCSDSLKVFNKLEGSILTKNLTGESLT